MKFKDSFYGDNISPFDPECAWCRKQLDFEKLILGNRESVFFSPVKKITLLLLGINIANHRIRDVPLKFIIISFGIALPNIHTAIVSPETALDTDCAAVILTCSAECQDYFDLALMNLIHDKFIERPWLRRLCPLF